MNTPLVDAPNAALDLTLDRLVDLPVERLWAAWTEPDHLVRWFTPAPWRTVACEIDLRPGGRFRTRMQGPAGEAFDNLGCYLVVEAPHRLVWTGALLPGYRPRPAGPEPFLMTAELRFSTEGGRSRYQAHVLHADEEARRRHEQMGFEAGWSRALEQLIEAMR